MTALAGSSSPGRVLSSDVGDKASTRVSLIAADGIAMAMLLYC